MDGRDRSKSRRRGDAGRSYRFLPVEPTTIFGPLVRASFAVTRAQAGQEGIRASRARACIEHDGWRRDIISRYWRAQTLQSCARQESEAIEVSSLGKHYEDGEVIVRQGENGNCMYVIQEGTVDVIASADGRELHLRSLGANDFFGEMALFEGETRTATIRSNGPSQILTIDKKSLLGGIHEDPSLAFRILQTMSYRIRDLTERLARCEEET